MILFFIVLVYLAVKSQNGKTGRAVGKMAFYHDETQAMLNGAWAQVGNNDGKMGFYI